MKFVARRGDQTISVEVERSGSSYRLVIGDRTMSADLIEADGHLRSLRLDDGRQFLFTHHREGKTHSVSFGGQEVQLELLDPLAMRADQSGQDNRTGSGLVRAFMPGRVVRILIEAGGEVKRGQGLLILEAMKMENEITAPHDGKIGVIHVQPGQTVESGADLMELE